ncbi:unnamed protein product [Mytilus coruscus]|uniref:Uncharacterized protein n=1 Tax=Mytilus coruscus TaxID=42192 RepID=A0A6J8C727_MYTCO|nr:unnamed protein product [Mytilus coruscus]
MDWKTRIQPIIDDLHLQGLTHPTGNKTGAMQVMETEELQNLPSNERKIKNGEFNLATESISNETYHTTLTVVTETENKTDIAFKIRILNSKEPKRLQWQTSNGENIIAFSDITNIQMKGKSGMKVLQVDTKNERYVFKSSDMGEIVELLKQLEENFIMPNSTNL